MFAGILVVVFALFAFVNFSALAGLTARDVFGDSGLFGNILGMIKNYIYFNYINLDMEFHFRENYTYGKFTFFFLTKLLDPSVAGYFDTVGLIVLDENYNMGTFVREYFVDFGYFGVLLVPWLLGLLTGYVDMMARRTGAPYYTIFLGILMTACAFAFFGNQFIRLQFIYLVLVAYFMDAFTRSLQRQRDKNRCAYNPCAGGARAK
jgi:oligosaccharide repeat unit polymerase